MALHELQMPTIMLWPNVDAGSEDVARGMRRFRERYKPEYIRFYKNFPVETYLRLMKSAACLVGNSSASIREGAFIGTPAVNIGSRQDGRERGPNVIDVARERSAILSAIRQQLAHGPYEPAHLYGDGRAGVRIADVLATTPLHVQKRIQYHISSRGAAEAGPCANLSHASTRRDSGARRVEGHSAQEPCAARRQAADRLYLRCRTREPPAHACAWSAPTTRRSQRRRRGAASRCRSCALCSWR